MSASVYYNEIEPYCAQWLRKLMDDGHIPVGDIDTRSIEDVRPEDLRGYTQLHFFAGIGGWAHALQIAGWGTRPVWTGSCPCQPFSAAGKGAGFADERHLWPAWFHLISQCRPATIFGEQVAAAIRHQWLDGVCADMEGQNYAIGAAILPACAVNAPHRRDRLWFVADTDTQRGASGISGPVPRQEGPAGITHDCCGEGHVVDTNGERRYGRQDATNGDNDDRSKARWWQSAGGIELRGEVALADTSVAGLAQRERECGVLRKVGSKSEGQDVADDGHSVDYANRIAGRQGRPVFGGSHQGSRSQSRAGSGSGSNGIALADANDHGCASRDAATTAARHWHTVESSDRADSWIIGHDGKARRVEPGIRLLAHGVFGRMVVQRTDEQTGTETSHTYSRIGALRGLGNAIVPQVAAEFIGAYMDARGLIVDRQKLKA